MLSLLLFLSALALAVFAISLMTPIVGDYFSFARPTTLAFLRGESNLYDSQSPYFYNAPWTLALWIPFVGFPYTIGQMAHELLYILCVLVSIALVRKNVPKAGILFVIFNIPCFILIVAAGTDALLLLGVVLGYVALSRKNSGLLAVSFFVMATKPQNVVLVVLLLLYASHDWKATLLPIGAAVVSGLFIGLDWPLRYVDHLQIQPPLADPRIELWQALPPVPLATLALLAILALAYLVRREGFNEWTFGLALVTNLVFSVYVLWVHFIVLIPVLLFLARRDWRLALIPWLVSWLLPFTPRGAPWFGMIYPLSVFVVLWLVVLVGPQRTVADTRLSLRA